MNEKALDFFYQGKVRKEFETPERIHFTVVSKEDYPVIFDRKKGWSCSCKLNTIKDKECKHIEACKLFLESETVDELAKKERHRAQRAFENLKLRDEKGRDLLNLAKSYFEDANHFFDRNKFVEAFELYSYLWGILDSLARLGYIDPGRSKKDFKIDQD